MEFQIKTFSELTTAELYELIRLRAEVFVVEQDCVYLDLDNLDQQAWHIIGTENGEILAYARILKPGDYYREAMLGRIVTAKKARGKNYGRAIVKRGIEEINKLYPESNIRIMAQSYLVKFYQAFGFIVASEEFLEDGIPHIEMQL